MVLERPRLSMIIILVIRLYIVASQIFPYYPVDFPNIVHSCKPYADSCEQKETIKIGSARTRSSILTHGPKENIYNDITPVYAFTTNPRTTVGYHSEPYFNFYGIITHVTDVYGDCIYVRKVMSHICS